MKVLAGANPDYTAKCTLNGKARRAALHHAAKKLEWIVYQEVDMAWSPRFRLPKTSCSNDMVERRQHPLVNWPKLRTQAKGPCWTG